MASQVEWKDLGFPSYYEEDDVPFAGTRNVAYRSQAFPKEIFDWLTTELEDAKITDFLHKKIADWMISYDHKVQLLEHGCLIDGLVAELQYQKFSTLRPWVQRPRMKSQDLFVIANKGIVECFLVRSDISFRKGPFHWEFNESDVKRRKIGD